MIPHPATMIAKRLYIFTRLQICPLYIFGNKATDGTYGSKYWFPVFGFDSGPNLQPLFTTRYLLFTLTFYKMASSRKKNLLTGITVNSAASNVRPLESRSFLKRHQGFLQKHLRDTLPKFNSSPLKSYRFHPIGSRISSSNHPFFRRVFRC